MPVISLSDQKDIVLRVTVTNQDGDDAHEARIVVLLPHSLTYSTYHVLHEVRCFDFFCTLQKCAHLTGLSIILATCNLHSQ